MNEEQRIKKVMIAIIVVLLTAIICLGATILLDLKETNKSGILLEDFEDRVKINALNQSISIHGFSEVHMKSGELELTFDFYNPKTNDCYMDIELLLPDGKSLFEIKRIEPGYGIKEIQLKDVLENGDYLNCQFLIKCYSMADGSQLNGAAMNVNLYMR